MPDETNATSVTFVPAETLLLEPGAIGEVVVQVEPPGFHTVSFSLVANPSDTHFDGFLDAASVMTDEYGIARNEVRAPTASAVFSVRASVDDTLFSMRTISVSTEGFATLVATPEYAGVREFDSWTAVASLGTTCSELESLWTGGALEARGNGEQATLPGVPVGADVALVLKAGEYIGGCATVSGLTAGEQRELRIPVTDRPLQLAGTSLELWLDIDERTEPFVALLAGAAERGALDYALDFASDADVLLADCAESIEDDSDRDAFVEAAEQFGYRDRAAATLKQSTALRETVRSQLLEAATRVDGAGVWALSAELDGSSSMLVLEAAAGVPAAMSGFLGSSDLSVVREPADRLVLGADLEFQATRWLSAIAEAASDAGPIEQLVEAAGCDDLVIAWVETASDEVYPGCDEECGRALCEDGLRLGWDRARTTAQDLTKLRIGISGDVEIDEDAKPTELRGDWVGSFDSGDLSVAGAVAPPSDDVP